MTIQTKFSTNDQVYVMSHNRVCHLYVIAIRILVENHNPDIRYLCAESKDELANEQFAEHDLFSTKEELIESLYETAD